MRTSLSMAFLSVSRGQGDVAHEAAEMFLRKARQGRAGVENVRTEMNTDLTA
jgi:hypothetical protein